MSASARITPSVLLFAAAAALFFRDPLLATFTLGVLLAGGAAVWLFVAGGEKAQAAGQPPVVLSPPASEGRPSAETTDTASAGTLLDVTMNSMREGLVIVDRGMRVLASNYAA